MYCKKPLDSDSKLELLFAAAEYDVCAPKSAAPVFGKTRQPTGIYSARLPNGKVCKLFKVLMTNQCEYNCLYCANRKNRNVPRAKFSPDELAKLFINYYRKNFVHGLFLSSAIYNSPVFTMDDMLKCVNILRAQYNYKGYVHLKILPGTTDSQISEAINLADRVSVNLEAPTEKYLKKLAPQKQFESDLMTKIRVINNLLQNQPRKVGISTQFVVGAVDETDKDIVSSIAMLRKLSRIRRVYFSAFTPITNTPLESRAAANPMREHRLYQIDWLFNFYGFTPEDICYDLGGNLSLDTDPKLLWAQQHPEFFPIEINTAEYEQLLRVPGVGPLSAKRITEIRKNTKIADVENLKKLGVVVKRAVKYITINNKTVNLPLEQKKQSPQLDLIPLTL